MTACRGLAAACALAAAAITTEASAEPRPAVEVKAERAEADLDLTDATLEGNVRVEAGRARLRADRLRLRRAGEGEVDVTGPATLALCPCDDPPISFGFERAHLDAGGTATIRGGSVKAFGHTVLPVPWLSLRDPSKLGLLPPRVAWRADDGLLAGAGVHVPLGARATVDVAPALYVRGGHELLVGMRTERSALSVRWDRREGELLGLDARGASRAGGASVAWDADVVRGERARRATVSLDGAARVYDRAGVAIVTAPGPHVLAASLRAVAPRGSAGGFVGPRVSAGGSVPLGAGAAAGWSLDGATVVRGEREAWHVVRGEVDALAAAFAGPVRATASSRLGVAALAGPAETAPRAFGLARAEAAFPVARRFEGGAVHVVEPRAALTGVASRETRALVDTLGRPLGREDGGAALAAGGLATQLGAPGLALSAAADGGALLREGASRPAAASAVSLDGLWARLRGEGALIGAPRGAVAVGRAAVGPRRGPEVGGSIAARDGVEPVEARALGGATVSPVSGGWLSAEGVSASAEVVFPFGRTVVLEGGAYFDVTASDRLGELAALRYRHPCGCLAVSAAASRRAGRGGVDGIVVVDLTGP